LAYQLRNPQDHCNLLGVLCRARNRLLGRSLRNLLRPQRGRNRNREKDVETQQNLLDPTLTSATQDAGALPGPDVMVIVPVRFCVRSGFRFHDSSFLPGIFLPCLLVILKPSPDFLIQRSSRRLANASLSLRWHDYSAAFAARASTPPMFGSRSCGRPCRCC